MFSKGKMFSLILLSVFFGMCVYASQSVANPIDIAVNCTMKPGGAEEEAIKYFKTLVEERSNGELQVNLFMGGQLGAEKEVLELLKIGQTQMALTGGLYRSDYAKEYDPITIPFLFPTWEAVEAFYAGPFGDKIKQRAAEQGGLVDFGPQKRAPRHMTANRKIVVPEDMKGMKMRLPQVPIWVDVWKELGVLPVVVPAPEIYMAMKTGLVEAHENSLVSPYSRRLDEVQKYIILTGHVYFPWEWVASKVWFDTLSPEHQEIIRQAVEEARKYGSKIEDEKDLFYLEELKKRGMEIIEPDLQAFRDLAKPAIERAVSELADGVYEEVERLSAQ
jgi:tripartite ATP-independent transporter DctP family solute receptor